MEEFKCEQNPYLRSWNGSALTSGVSTECSKRAPSGPKQNQRCNFVRKSDKQHQGNETCSSYTKAQVDFELVAESGQMEARNCN